MARFRATTPVINGVKSHMFTYGHRNPQGLVFVGNRLYSSEQGPSSDDEINILKPAAIMAGRMSSGFGDNQGYVYADYSAAPNCAGVKFDSNVIPAGVPTPQRNRIQRTELPRAGENLLYG